MPVNKDTLSRFYEEFSTFNEASHDYEDQKINAKEYKSVSTGFGEYLQRDNHQMLRIRIPGGRMTLAMARAILGCCQYYKIDRLKITSGQALQLHDLDPHAGRRLILRLLDKGIVTRGSGGDNPNNITASPLSGVEKGEYFDVQPYSEAADAYLLKYTGIEPLPRKFKIGFSNSPLNETHATIKDLGFVANPDHTFDVYAAGGLGINPKLGICVAKGIQPSKIIYYMRTMLDVYMENGNYKIRSKARSRFLQDTMGVEGFCNAFHQHLDEVLADGSLDINVQERTYTKKGDGSLTSQDPRLVPQKQPGLYAVSYHPAGGYLSSAKLEEIYQKIHNWEAVEIRLAPTGGLYVINCTASEAESLLPLANGAIEGDISASVVCVGHKRCDIGVADSQQLLRDCLNAVKKEDFPIGTLPAMHISGCISSCGSQHVGLIGWRGTAKRTAEGRKDAYLFSYGGCCLQGKEKLAYGKQTMLAEQIPTFLVTLGREVAQSGQPFSKWLEHNEARLNEIADSFAM
ncbi:MAG: nitrite/sulfite reductase [Bilifractor sp.]